MCLLFYIIYSGCCHVYFCCVVCCGWNSRCDVTSACLSVLKFKVQGSLLFVTYTIIQGIISSWNVGLARYSFQVWYTLVKGSIFIFICLYTLWAAAVYYKSSPKTRNPRLCNFSRECIFKIAHEHLCLCVCHSRYPGNTGSLYAHHTLTDNLLRCEDGKKLGSNLIKRLICVKKY